MTEEQMRAEFEAWLIENGMQIGRDDYLAGEPYTSVTTAGAWKGWQAALASQPKAEQAEPSEAELVCAEAYQVVGCLLDQLGLFESEQGQKILDNLSEARMVHQDVLPWAAVEVPKAPQ
jgi:hypothetical protein